MLQSQQKTEEHLRVMRHAYELSVSPVQEEPSPPPLTLDETPTNK